MRQNTNEESRSTATPTALAKASGGVGVMGVLAAAARSGRWVPVIACLAVACAGQVALAGPAISDFTGGFELPIAYGGSTSDVIGWRFEVTEPIIVTDLGVWAEDTSDDLNLGLTALHQVGIWDSSQTLLASTTVDPGTANFVAAFGYQSIAGLPLSPGETYTIGAVYAEFDADFYIFFASTLNMSTEVTWLNSVAPGAGNLGLVYPVLDSTALGSFGPNFLFVPAPGTLALLAFGAATGLTRKRRRN